MGTGFLAELDEKIGARQRQWLNNWQSRQTSPPSGKLFHYTDNRGLLGIVTSEAFWATHIEYLNDSSELAYGILLIQDRLEKKKTTVSQNALSSISQVLSTAQETFNAFSELTMYVSCFCEEGDLLSQWRGYGLRGGGYAIGIAPREVEAPREQPQIILRKVFYERSEQEQLVDESIVQLEDLWNFAVAETKDEPTLNEARNRILSFFRQEVGDYIWCFKDSAFREEREWRFSYLTGPGNSNKRPVKFRPSQNSIVPYVELDLFKLSAPTGVLGICDVVCGPTLHPRQGVDAVKQLMEAHDYKGVEVRASAVPLRG